MFYYSSGTRYEGSFYGDYCSGKGTMFYADGTTYKGDWYIDKKCGNGVQNYLNGDGTFYFANGKQWVGEFSNGKPVKGDGFWKNAEGKLEKLTLK